VDESDNLYVADASNNRVQEWRPGATAGITVAGGAFGNGASQFIDPTGVAVDAQGNLFVTDGGNLRIQEWAPGAVAGTTVVTLPRGQFGEAYGFYLDCGDDIYAAEIGNNSIVKYAAGAPTGVVVAGGNGPGAGADQLLAPGAIQTDAQGNLLIIDNGNARVQEFKLTSAITLSYTPVNTGKYWALVTDMRGYATSTDTVPFSDPAAGPPSIEVTASATDVAICTPVTFAAQVQNPGAEAAYQWEVSGVKAGGDSLTYSYNLFANGDEV
jgi:sugar lactone lactonase YvrE